MSHTNTQPNRVSDLFSLFRKNLLLLVIPLVLCTLAAAWFAFKPKMWQASQSLQVRDDLIGESFKPGRFDSLDSMKTAQQNILYNTTDFGVVKAALEVVGPPAGKGENWLKGTAGLENIESAREGISLEAPNGAEFGTTEVIVLKIKTKSRERSAKLVTALLDQIEAKLRKDRAQKLQSMESELGHALRVAEQDYQEFSGQLLELENEVGPDLPTLRSMVNDGHSTNDLQVALENLRIAQRAAEDDYQEIVALLDVLETTNSNPEALVATSEGLLEKQPALKRLKDGLVDAQLLLSTLRGQYEDLHPEVAKARFAVKDTEAQIRNELSLSLSGLRDQSRMQRDRVDRLRREQEDLQQRLLKLSKNRVRYATLSSQSKKRNEELADARNQFADIKSLGNAATTVNLVSRLDDKPFVGGKPLGPGKTTILGSGVLGGLIIGTGLIMFLAGPGLPLSQPVPNQPFSPGSGPSPNDPQGTGADNNSVDRLNNFERADQTAGRSQFSTAESHANGAVFQPPAESQPMPDPVVVSRLAEPNASVQDSLPPVTRSEPIITAPEPMQVEPNPFIDYQADSVFSATEFSTELSEPVQSESVQSEFTQSEFTQSEFAQSDFTPSGFAQDGVEPSGHQEIATTDSLPPGPESFATEPPALLPVVPSGSSALRPVQAVRNLESNQPPAHMSTRPEVVSAVETAEVDTAESVIAEIQSAFAASEAKPNTRTRPETLQLDELNVQGSVTSTQGPLFGVDTTSGFGSVSDAVQEAADKVTQSDSAGDSASELAGDLANDLANDLAGEGATGQTIDLNTLRAELGASPIAQPNPEETSLHREETVTFDFAEIQESLKQSQATEQTDSSVEATADSANDSTSESAETLEPLDSLHKRIEELTDPARTMRAKMRSEDFPPSES